MQQTSKVLLTLPILLMLFLGTGHTDPRTENVRVAIEARNAQFIVAFNQGDGVGVAALYTISGQLFPPDSDILSGRVAIERFWQDAVDSGIKGVTMTILEVEKHDNVVYEVGKYTMLGEVGQVLETGKYIVIWKQEQRQWMRHRDIWNTNMQASTSGQ